MGIYKAAAQVDQTWAIAFGRREDIALIPFDQFAGTDEFSLIFGACSSAGISGI
jgi:hypothetical protein